MRPLLSTKNRIFLAFFGLIIAAGWMVIFLVKAKMINLEKFSFENRKNVSVLGKNQINNSSEKTAQTENSTEAKDLQTQESASTEKNNAIIKNEDDEKAVKTENNMASDKNTDSINSTNSNKKQETTDNNSENSNAAEKKEASLDSGDFQIKKNLISWGYQTSNNRKIDTVILHSSYDALDSKNPYSVTGVLKEYKQYGVSAHFLIDRQGNIYQLVENKNIAYHAGVSQVPDGRKNVNDFSIGIELLNTEKDQYTDKQYAALSWLLKKIKTDYTIKYVLGHKEIAPKRKTDPWNFDSKKIND